MITATEARQKLIARDYQRIEEKIRVRIDNGESFAIVPRPKYARLVEVLAWLRNHGYHCEHRDETMIRVLW